MSQLRSLDHYTQLADRMVEVSSKEELSECVKLLAICLANYESKFGQFPPEDCLECQPIETANDELLQLVAKGMETLVGFLAKIIMTDENRVTH